VTQVVPSVGSTAASAQAATQGAAQAASSAGAPAATSSELASVIQSANGHYTRAQEALRAGDWARYGDEQRALEADLKRLSELAQ